VDGERRPASDGALDSDHPAVTFDNLADNVQAQPLAMDMALADLGPTDEPLEDAVPLLRKDADPVV
jgi:hypothetical protein